jgi:DNA-binding CsgD family transcriptional regulator/tetratricopeptide (TPR) repeat protein
MDVAGEGVSVASPDLGEFLERGEDLRVLGDAFAAVCESGHGRLVLVAGEAGVGKTALIGHFCESQRGPVQVLWGACEPLLTPRPLGPLCDVAETTGGLLEKLVAGDTPSYEVASALIHELGGRGPTVLVLEDLHWADGATLDVVRLLGRRIGSVPALVVASFRDDELDRAQELRIVVGELVGASSRLELAPLSREAVSQLASPRGVDGGELYGTTGGNPFFVTEVLGAGGERIPGTVRDAVLARAGRLSVPAQRLLQAVAVVPGRAELWLLEALEGELGARLQECLAAGMLRAVDGGVAFRHELARRAIEASVAPDRALAFHRAALAALASSPVVKSDPARLAHHAEALADCDEVLRWAPRAAMRAASVGAHREAAHQYARALRFEQGLSGKARAELLERQAEECFLTNEFDHAIDLLERALSLRDELGDQRRSGDLLSSLARVVFTSGRTPDADELASEAVARLEPIGDTRELARAYATRALLRSVLDDLDGAVRWGNAAIELAERLGDTETLVHALNSVGTVRMCNAVAGGEEQLTRSLRLAQEAKLDSDVGRAFNNLVAVAVDTRAYGVAERFVEPGIEYCEERGLELWRHQLLASRMRLELHRGRWAPAVRFADQLVRLVPTPHGRISALLTIGIVRARSGAPGAWEMLDKALTLAEPTDELQCIGPAVAARAEVLWLHGRQDETEAATRQAFALARGLRASWVLGELACWRWRAGMHDELPAGEYAEPYALSIAGEWRRAAERWREIGCPYEAALALADANDVDALRQALVELQALGARGPAAIVARRLRARGARGLPRGPRPGTRANRAGLTGRELEVLALLVAGLRNAQIADRLVVSERTVDHHVSAILRKLDASTRGEAAATATRLALIDPA